MVTRAIASAQSQVEGRNFEIRKNVLKYDDVLNRQREVIYAERRKVLEGADLHEQIRHFIDDVIKGYVVRRRPARATPRTGTSTSCGPRSRRSTRWASPSRMSSQEAGGRAGVTAGRCS